MREIGYSFGPGFRSEAGHSRNRALVSLGYPSPRFRESDYLLYSACLNSWNQAGSASLLLLLALIDELSISVQAFPPFQNSPLRSHVDIFDVDNGPLVFCLKGLHYNALDHASEPQLQCRNRSPSGLMPPDSDLKPGPTADRAVELRRAPFGGRTDWRDGRSVEDICFNLEHVAPLHRRRIVFVVTLLPRATTQIGLTPTCVPTALKSIDAGTRQDTNADTYGRPAAFWTWLKAHVRLLHESAGDIKDSFFDSAPPRKDEQTLDQAGITAGTRANGNTV
ncbi:hypothetical protein CkaCkLH20_13026 [Colletotrichum karsti]|uniref:Uncharacterized protein n=1 Tax=Colletotrichum karsti TaxID=1095194 RepID=A0A9P6LDS0_9PEZI|nr:uncharacterized protein CkaCkLH20_13026 [Colletotrichum karsti]KAF9869488.1 hypothetical protein CkaCkLH20_13026 [Colletotrichum karsti]